MNKQQGLLIIIGGHVDLDHGREILEEVVHAAKAGNGHGKILVTTAAAMDDQASGETYIEIFDELGADQVEVLEISSRDDANRESNVRKLDEASLIFFTGGDQVRISSQLGGTPLFARLQECFQNGTTVAGTSAGAMAIPDAMLTRGPSDESVTVSVMEIAPGLGLLKGAIIDSHFAERGRIGRLLGAVAMNPAYLGIGIDEETAIVVDGDEFRVIGNQAVYVLDGETISHTSWEDDNPEGILSLFDVRLHVLGAGDHFHLRKRHPYGKMEEQSQSK